jgi:Cytochrome c554 and c-prime
VKDRTKPHEHRRFLCATTAILALPLLFGLGADGRTGSGRESASASEAVRAFLARHWQLPISPQGPAPAEFTPIEASLDPSTCGSCHAVQYGDWQRSLHARSMGPGVMGQIVDMMRSDPSAAMDCQRCHSPLAEQQQKRLIAGAQGEPVLAVNPPFDARLRAKGLVCAACHVRSWERFGPPRRDGTLESNAPRERLPHNGATRTPAFLKSEFCMGCHQFPQDGFALNGKLLENTYEEWRASAYARAGIQCQDCHMPDRRHLWRGIHDPETVRRGVTVDLKTQTVGAQLRAVLTVTNSGVGHYFPTYLTPKVFLLMDLVDEHGRQVAGSLRQAVIGREAPLDLSHEVYDTRLPPQASFSMKETWGTLIPGRRLRARVVVEPDHFYTKFFQAEIPGAERGRAQLEEALRHTQQSAFTIFSRETSL